MDLEKVKAKIQSGQTALGIELGSTRIKAVLMTDTIETVATGSFNWENRPENVEDLLPDETIRIRISVGEDLSRDLVWED